MRVPVHMLTLCLMAGRASTSFCSPSCLLPTCTSGTRIRITQGWLNASNPAQPGGIGQRYLQEHSDNGQAVVSTHSLLKQTVLVGVPVDQVELKTHRDVSTRRF